MTTVTSTISRTGPAFVQPVEIAEIGDRAGRDAFVRVPWRIYSQDPVWVPPMLMERKEFIHPDKHPFYLHGAAAQFLARINGQDVGRILVSDDPRYNQEHGTNLGCFGMFESIDDPRVAHALLDKAAAWLAARGRTQIMGPIDYSTNYSCGLLIEGFHTPPRVMMNHNPPYYSHLLESWGLEKAKDLYSWWFTDAENLGDKWLRLYNRLMRRGNITIRPFRLDDFDAEVERCKMIYNAAWEKNWGFVKMTDAEFDHFAGPLRHWVAPEYLLMAEIDGRVVGFSMSLPDFNEAMRPLNGKLFKFGMPIGLLQFWRNCKKIKTSRLVTLGVLSDYRRRGVSELLILGTLNHGKHVAKLTGSELGWTLEDNDLINRSIEASGAKRYKTYRIYEKALT